MNGVTLLIVTLQALVDVTAQAFAERPLLWSVMLIWVATLSCSVGALLDKQGWAATGWAAVSASFFAIWVVIA